MTSLQERLDQLAQSVAGGDHIDGAGLYRESMARARRRRASLVSMAAAATVAGVVVVASLVSTGGNPVPGPESPPGSVDPSDSSGLEGTCTVGEERLVFRGVQGDESTSVLLACVQLADGREVELFSGIQSGGLCLQIVGIDSRVRECGNAPSEQEPPMTGAVAAQAIAQPNSSAALEVYGAVSTDVTTVSLRYTQGGSPQLARAEVIHVKDRGALERAGIGEPFGYFVGELPAKASNVTALAKNGEGRALGRAGFEPFLRSQPRRAFISGPSR